MKLLTLFKASPIVMAISVVATTANGFDNTQAVSQTDAKDISTLAVEELDNSRLVSRADRSVRGSTTASTTCQKTPACTKVSVETIDVLVLYDDIANAKYNNNIRTVIKSWENQINTFYENSGVGLKARFVATYRYNPTSNDIDSMLADIRKDSNIAAQREAVGADLVTLVQGKHRAYCGVGYTSVGKGSAFSVILESCGALTMVHEMGHNMGLNHSRRQGNTGGTRYAYGLGHGVQGKFSTIMAYPSSFRTNNRLGVFSNPTLKCMGHDCGVAVNNADQAYSALAINNVRHELRDFMPTKR